MSKPEANVIAYSPAQAAELLGVTRQTIFALLKTGQLRRFKVGRCTRIPVADVHALVDYQPVDGAA
jgi:excisionase family DNA binding protein